MARHEGLAKVALAVAFASQQIRKEAEMKKSKMEKCKTCANLDREKSNNNWTVCPIIPVNVLAGDSADKCANFKPITNP